MIDRVVLESFQCHAQFDLTLGPVTTLCGRSDVGKSSVLRALRWLATNQPAGDAFVRRGAKGCSVAARIDGTWVARRRGTKENVYQVGNDLPLQLERGGAVPKAVADLLNVGSSNFAGQHDGPFWLGDTPGQAAKNLNGIVDLTRIDAAAEAANAGVRQAKAALDAADARLARAEHALTATDWVAGCAPELEKLEAAEREIVRTRTRREALAELVRRAESARATHDAASLCASAGGAVVFAATDLANTVARRTALAGVLDAASRAKVAHTAGVPKAAWDALVAVRAGADDAAKRRGELEVLVGEADETWGVVCRHDDELKRLQADLTALTDRLGGICPTCGQPADPSQFASVIPISAPASPPPVAKPRGGGVTFRLPT